MIRLESNKSALYQWDLNMRVILTNVPAGTEVHYSNASYNMNENCITVVSYSENGCVYADIPNKILQTSGVVLAYIYIQDEDKAWTEFETEILVLPRKKPADYVYTETEIKTFESLEKRIESLESTQDPDAIKNAVDDYLEQNPPSGGITKIPIATHDTIGGIKIGDNLRISDDGVLSVVTADAAERDNTLPITSAAVYTAVGNIEVRLSTI